jgi:hypothetical protein
VRVAAYSCAYAIFDEAAMRTLAGVGDHDLQVWVLEQNLLDTTIIASSGQITGLLLSVLVLILVAQVILRGLILGACGVIWRGSIRWRRRGLVVILTTIVSIRVRAVSRQKAYMELGEMGWSGLVASPGGCKTLRRGYCLLPPTATLLLSRD